MKSEKLKIKNKKRGFTVLESIVAITILSLSISGVFTSIQQSLSQATMSKDEVKAYYLAQEAMEMIRNIRDTNRLTRIDTGSGDWLDGISSVGTDPCYFGKVCKVDATGPSLIYLSYCGTDWGDCPFLNQDSATYIYSYGSGDATKFKREVKIERVRDDALGNPVEIAVIVRITWSKGIINRSFEAKTYLLNWI